MNNNLIGNYYVDIYKALNEKINWFIENYSPTNLTVSGTTVLGTNTTIGASDSDILTVNAQATFTNGITSDDIITDSLTVKNNTTIGQDDTDILTVNSNAIFESETVFNSQVTVTENIILGTDSTNTVTATGIVTAPHFTIPKTSDNSFRFGSSDLIVYHEYTSDNANIYTEYPNSVVVQIKNKNTNGYSMAIIYDSSDSYITLNYNDSVSFLKNSTTSFVRIQ